MQQTGLGAASQLPSSFPHAARRAEKLERSCATALHSSAAEAGVLKDVTKAHLDLPPSAPLHRKSTCTHARRLKTTQTYNSVYRGSETSFSGRRSAELETHKVLLALTVAAFVGIWGIEDTVRLLPLSFGVLLSLGRWRKALW